MERGRVEWVMSDDDDDEEEQEECYKKRMCCYDIDQMMSNDMYGDSSDEEMKWFLSWIIIYEWRIGNLKMERISLQFVVWICGWCLSLSHTLEHDSWM